MQRQLQDTGPSSGIKQVAKGWQRGRVKDTPWGPSSASRGLREPTQALRQQVQALITKELGTGAAASALEHVASVAELRALDLSSIQQLGLGIGAHVPSLPPQTSHLMQLCYTRDFFSESC